jgi:inorganic triphosphatase YgiF
MEIEAKYTVTEEALDTVSQVRELGAYTLHPAPAAEEQENIYYDTADSRLSTARYGLRLRRVGDRSLITLKGPTDGNDGLHRRAEYELPGASPDPVTWPAGVARDLTLALTGGAPLAPLLRIVTERRVLHAERDGVLVAEICLDRGTIYAGDRSAPISELEIEQLPDGTADDLAALAAALVKVIRLRPEPRSKLERGLSLLHEGRIA